MKTFLVFILAILGIGGVTIGKYGTIVALVAWVCGLIGVIPSVAFGWVPLFMSLYVIGYLSATSSAVLSKM